MINGVKQIAQQQKITQKNTNIIKHNTHITRKNRKTEKTEKYTKNDIYININNNHIQNVRLYTW